MKSIDIFEYYSLSFGFFSEISIDEVSVGFFIRTYGASNCFEYEKISDDDVEKHDLVGSSKCC